MEFDTNQEEAGPGTSCLWLPEGCLLDDRPCGINFSDTLRNAWKLATDDSEMIHSWHQRAISYMQARKNCHQTDSSVPVLTQRDFKNQISQA